ncbi:hypothetical protein U1Q18_032253, partial [Sarracenia purpurea var. burkii]
GSWSANLAQVSLRSGSPEPQKLTGDEEYCSRLPLGQPKSSLPRIAGRSDGD